MQTWHDDALILGQSRHGESAAVVHVLSRIHGKSAGYVRGADNRQTKPVLQGGNHVHVTWSSRLADQLGSLVIEPVAALAAPLMQRTEHALALQSLCQTLLLALPERQPYPAVFDGTLALLRTMGSHDNWLQAYIWWEVHLLAALGFGLRLTECARGGSGGDLTHVSPRSGHAASRDIAAPYAHKMLRLPQFLGGADDLGPHENIHGLGLTGYFIDQHIAKPQNKKMPDARGRLVALAQNGSAANTNVNRDDIRYG